MREGYILQNGDTAATVWSVPYAINEHRDYSIHLTFTNDATGTVSLYCANDPNEEYSLIEDSEVEIENCPFLYNVAEAGYKWIKMKWTPPATHTNTGTMKAYLVVKSLMVTQIG